jgi:hypothetical protein
MSFQDLCSDKGIADESMVQLLVWTQRRTAAFDSLVTAWDRALAQACKDAIGTQQQMPLLDVQVIEDTEIEKHFGAGRSARMATHQLAVYWLQTTNQVVDIVYARRGV